MWVDGVGIYGWVGGWVGGRRYLGVVQESFGSYFELSHTVIIANLYGKVGGRVGEKVGG